MFRVIFYSFLLIIFIFDSLGCESFRKKFVRKPKKEREEGDMIITPKDYSAQQLSSSEAYKQYYTYWKAWQDELVGILKKGVSKKKIMSCFEQAILNLNRMKELISSEEKIKSLEDYIAKLSTMESEVRGKEFAMISINSLRVESERLLRSIHRDFSFSKVEGSLK